MLITPFSSETVNGNNQVVSTQIHHLVTQVRLFFLVLVFQVDLLATQRQLYFYAELKDGAY